MGRPDTLFTAATGAVQRKLLAAICRRIWIDDDGHLLAIDREFQPLVADIRDAVLHTPTDKKSAGENSNASSSERLNLYRKVICSSNTSSVEPVHRNSNKSVLLPPPLVGLQQLAGLASNPSASNSLSEPSPRRLRRRLDPALVAEIVAKYQSGATTPSLCVEYTLSKGALLKLLRDEGVQLRCQPLDDEQVREATKLYKNGKSLAAIAAHFDVSYNGVRQAFVRQA